MFPNPTALPAAAITKPIVPVKFALFLFIFSSFPCSISPYTIMWAHHSILKVYVLRVNNPRTSSASASLICV